MMGSPSGSRRAPGSCRFWMDGPPAWKAATFVWALVAPLGLAGCAGLRGTAIPAGPRARLLEEPELPVVMTRLGTAPRRVVTRAEEVPLQFFFDPGLVDVAKIEEYTLWERQEAGGAWVRGTTVKPEALPLRYETVEGVVGLRASVTIAGGVEKLVPTPADDPALWLCVDRSAPSIVWTGPAPESSIRGARTIELAWSAEELQFGASPTRLEWSADRGVTWKKIADVPSRAGQQTYAWRLPEEVCSDILVRVAAADMVGLQSDAILVLNYPGSATPGGPALASAVTPPEGLAPAQSSPAEATEGAGEEVAADGGGGEAGVAVASSQGSGAPAAGAAPSDVNAASGPNEAIGAGAAAKEDIAAGEPQGAGAGAAPADDLPRLVLQEPATRFVTGGSSIIISWSILAVEGVATPEEAPLLLEVSRDGGAEWTQIARGTLGAGAITARVPPEEGQYLVRLRFEGHGASPGSSPRIAGRWTEPLVVVAAPPLPPTLQLGALPGAVRSTLEVSAALEGRDSASTGPLPALEVRLQGADGSWKTLGRSERSWDGRTLTLDLSQVAEGTYEVYVELPTEAQGVSFLDFQGPPMPGSAPEVATPARSRGRIRVDRTPPALAVERLPGPWAAGLTAELRIHVDVDDLAPPLLLEERRGDGSWVEAGRWSTLPPDGGSCRFLIPTGISVYEVRIVAADALGNRAIAELSPQKVETPIRLTSFQDSRTYPALGSERIAWEVPGASAAGDLTVTVSHRVGQGEWSVLFDGLKPGAEAIWDLPRGDAEEHTLRVQLERSGRLIGEDVSLPFRIGGEEAPLPSVVRIREASMEYSNQGLAQLDQYIAALRTPGASPTELARLAQTTRATFEKALAQDPSNYHAAYGIAQLLNRQDPDGNAPEVKTWLLRTLEIQADHVWALNDLGVALIRAGDYPGAEEALRSCVRLEGSAVAHYNLGLSLYSQGKYAAARSEIEAASRASGSELIPDGDAAFYVIQCYIQEGQVDKARGIFKEKEQGMPAELRQAVAASL